MRKADKRLAEVLAALAPDDAADAEVPEDVLRAFAEHAPVERVDPVDSARRSGARTLGIGRAAAVKIAVVVLAVSSGTVAAAAADVLPGPAQRAAHSLLGRWGVPAPHETHRSTPSAPAPSPSARVSASAASRAAQPGSSHVVTVSSSSSASCTGANTHAASEHCAGRPTVTPGHRHTPSPHSSATH
jgi:hypothetical protein